MIRKFRPQIRADLQKHFGADLGVFLYQRRWRALLELIEMLPHASLLWEARLNDPVEAELILDQMEAQEDEDGKQSAHEVAIREHDRHSVQLEDLKDLLGNLINTVRGVAGSKPARFQRDKTRSLIDQLRWERDIDSASDILSMAGFDPDEAMPV